MANLLEEASILITPTAYNDGSMLSVKPENGDGDFTFSRNSAATRVNAQGLVENVLINLPRINYEDGCGSWLLEPQSTNLYLNSETLSTQNNTTSATTYSVSFYGTGTITFSGAYSGTLVGTGLSDRVSATFSAASGTLVSAVSGTCTKAQLESGYKKSYIPTQGASSTRLKDIATNSGNANLINSEEGVFYAEISSLANDSTFKLISLNNDLSNSSNNAITIGFSNGNNFYLRVVVNGTAILSSTNISATKNQYYKVAIKFNSLGDNAIWIDGVEVLSNTTSFTYPVIIDNLSFDYNGNGGLPFHGEVKALAVFKTVLTYEQLTSLTTK